MAGCRPKTGSLTPLAGDCLKKTLVPTESSYSPTKAWLPIVTKGRAEAMSRKEIWSLEGYL